MVILQQLQVARLDTFGDISDFVFKRISRGNAATIYFVTDQYLDHSIKEMERKKRGSSGTLRIKLARHEQKIPKQFKTNFCVKFLCAEQLGNKSICIGTVDSGIAIYSVYFADKFRRDIYIDIGSGKSRRILDAKAIYDNIGSSISQALPVLHAFTGNDYTSAFHAVVKIKAYKILKKFEHYQYAFGMIGEDFEFNMELFEVIQEFACALYGLKSMADVNVARYVKFCSKKGRMPEPQQLPPTRDELLQHCKRVSFVTAIIKQALEPNVEYPSWLVTYCKWQLRNRVDDSKARP
eukprot:gene8324-9215_t